MISIVAPVYNIEKYLSAFIESIICQTYTNWELMLVDDGSVDSSGRMCDEYASKDKRIKVIHKSNGGVSTARNEGLKIVSGEWLLMPDADDTLSPNALEVLLSYTNDDVDLICGSYTRYVLGRIVPERRPAETRKYSVEEYVEEIGKLTGVRNIDRYCWNKLFRMSVIKDNNILFDESLSYREDILYIYQYLMKCSHYIQCISYNMYTYYRRDTGAALSLQTVYTPKSSGKFYSMVRCYDILEQMEASSVVKRRMKLEILKAYNEVKCLIANEKKWKEDSHKMHEIRLRYYSRKDLTITRIKKLIGIIKARLFKLVRKPQ